MCFHLAQLVLGCCSILPLCALLTSSLSLSGTVTLFVCGVCLFFTLFLRKSFCLSTQQLVRDSLTLLVLVLFCCLTFNFIFFSWSSYSPPLTAAFLCSPHFSSTTTTISLHFFFLPLSLSLTYTHATLITTSGCAAHSISLSFPSTLILLPSLSQPLTSIHRMSDPAESPQRR